MSISYMGTKRDLAPQVRNFVADLRPGPLLDAFAGMASVGHAIAPARQVWSNDAQLFAVEVGKASFMSRERPPSARTVALHFEAAVEGAEQKRRQAYRAGLSIENEALGTAEFDHYQLKLTELDEWISRSRIPQRDVFSRNYSNAYFSLGQAIELDSIRSVLQTHLLAGQITHDLYRWCLVALGAAMIRLSNSPGHFAQFLKPKAETFQRHQKLKRRSVWAEWLVSISTLTVSGTYRWRKKNKVFNDNAVDLLTRLAQEKDVPGVVYLDPPYTDDQYSRYYHLFETLVTYRPHKTTGIGRYPSGRFVTPFSHKSTVLEAFDAIIRSAKFCGSDLVISYPSNGLLSEIGEHPLALMQKHYPNAICAASISHSHSTFGASKGLVSAPVTENIYVAAA